MGDVIKDILMGKIFGGGGTSSGGGDTEESGTTGIAAKDVNFYDYDGALLHAYTVAEAQALTELPAGPTHDGLTFQGWNWSLENVKALTRPMNIGAMYITDDGKTRLYITLQEGRTSPILGGGVNGTVKVDWGDGTEPDVLTGTNLNTIQWTPNHAYAAPGDYVITLAVDGEMTLIGNSSTNGYAYILRHTSGSDKRNSVYQNALRKAEIGENVRVRVYAFAGCSNLASVILPDCVVSIEGSAFLNCYGLTWVNIPNGMTEIAASTFTECHALKLVCLPERLASIGGTSFKNCYSLLSVTMPASMTSIAANAFRDCHGIAFVVMPSGVASVDAAFYYCYGVGVYDFTACAAVPTLASSMGFSGIADDCEIRVPAALYDEWIAATNWATYASQIKAY